jgi:hypothetical protein
MKIFNDELVWLSEQEITDCVQTCHNPSYHGGFVREAFDFITANGACSEGS